MAGIFVRGNVEIGVEYQRGDIALHVRAKHRRRTSVRGHTPCIFVLGDTRVVFESEEILAEEKPCERSCDERNYVRGHVSMGNMLNDPFTPKEYAARRYHVSMSGMKFRRRE